VIVIFGKLTAQPGKRDELVRGLDAIRVDAESEPGTLVFTVHTARDHDDVVLCYEVYRDQAAMDDHRQGRSLLAFMDVIGDLIAGAPELYYVTPVGAKIDPSVAMPRSIADA
jgi:quinol monooxygenase YgiN